MAFTMNFIVFVITMVLCCTYCCEAEETQTQQSIPMKSNDNEADQLDQEAIMMICNETFRTSMGS